MGGKEGGEEGGAAEAGRDFRPEQAAPGAGTEQNVRPESEGRRDEKGEEDAAAEAGRDFRPKQAVPGAGTEQNFRPESEGVKDGKGRLAAKQAMQGLRDNRFAKIKIPDRKGNFRKKILYLHRKSNKSE